MTTAQTETRPFDAAGAEAFAGKVGDIINSGAIAIMISIGHRTGLFDLMAGGTPATSERIASSAGLSERYVREWLAALVSGGVVRYEAASRTYDLPPEHAACLTRSGSLGNLAVYAQHVPLLGSVQELILERFRTGLGTRYDDYPRFHEVMAEDSDQTVVAQLFSHILPLAPGLPERLRQGIDVLDAGCGRGRALLAMARQFPASRFVGYDFSEEAIATARAAASREGLGNVRLDVQDLTTFEESNRYDLICSFDAVHDQKHPQDFLHRLHEALKGDGTYLLQDIGGSARLENNSGFPMAALLYTVSCMHCMPISLGQGGDGLGTMWGWETALQMLEAAGFRDVTRNVLPHDPMNTWFVASK